MGHNIQSVFLHLYADFTFTQKLLLARGASLKPCKMIEGGGYTPNLSSLDEASLFLKGTYLFKIEIIFCTYCNYCYKTNIN